MPTVADAMKVRAAPDLGAATIEVDADLVPRAALRALRPYVRECRQPREMNGCGVLHRAHLAAVIDCHDRELVGYELSLRARAKEAERALENACLARLAPCGRRVRRRSYPATTV